MGQWDSIFRYDLNILFQLSLIDYGIKKYFIFFFVS